LRLLSPLQIAALNAPLDRAHVQTRSQSGRSLSYLEGWVAIQEANRIFGFDGWQRETVDLRCVAEHQRPIGRDQKPGWGVTYVARVRILLGGPAFGAPVLVRDGSGAGHGIDADLGLAHESALKEAETDAMKRALMTFGNPFGLALYDKQQRQVADIPVGPSPVELAQAIHQAEAAIQASALTQTGISALLLQFGNGNAAFVADLPFEALKIIPKLVAFPEKVAALNRGQHTATGEQLLPLPSDDDQPLAWS
jgi:hypothetical protein